MNTQQWNDLVGHIRMMSADELRRIEPVLQEARERQKPVPQPALAPGTVLGDAETDIEPMLETFVAMLVCPRYTAGLDLDVDDATASDRARLDMTGVAEWVIGNRTLLSDADISQLIKAAIHRCHEVIEGG